MLGLRCTSFGVFVILSVLAAVSGYQALRCTVCHQARHLAQCEDTTVCDNTHSVCYVEKVVNADGIIHINAGCRNKTECDSTGCFGEFLGARGNVSRARRAVAGGNSNSVPDARLCHHCCDGDFCNMYGCPDSYDLEHIPGKRCFSCELVHEPEHCQRTSNCAANEACFIQKMALGADRWYRSGCVSEAMCNMLDAIHSGSRGRRDATQLWSECCKNHMCNGHLQVDVAPPSRDSASYQCPLNKAPDVVAPHSAQGGGGESAKCFSCRGVHSLQECNHIEYCEHDEICFSETAASTTDVIYNLGCAKKKMCEILDRLSKSHRRRRDVYFPQKSYCCNGDMCNGNLDGNNQSSKTSIESTTTTAAASGLTATRLCQDYDSDCNTYGRGYICTPEYENWSRLHCAKYCNLCDGGSSSAATTPSSTSKPLPTALVPATSLSGCRDAVPDCHTYDKNYICVPSFEKWAKQNCAKYCGYCTDVTSTSNTTTPAALQPTPAASLEKCDDVASDCDTYGKNYICVPAYEVWAKKNCAKYCGYCTAPATAMAAVTTEACVDVEPDCPSFGFKYICTPEYRAWSLQHCAKFCGLC